MQKEVILKGSPKSRCQGKKEKFSGRKRPNEMEKKRKIKEVLNKLEKSFPLNCACLITNYISFVIENIEQFFFTF